MSQVYTVPNVLSAIRIVLTPLVVWGIVTDDVLAIYFTLCIVSFAEILDLADGYIARTRNVVSEIGKLLDPLADTLFHICIYIALLTIDLMSVWVVVILYSCTICVAYFRTVAASNGFVMAARPWGKIKANFQAYGALLVLVLVCYDALQKTDPQGLQLWLCVAMISATALGIFAFLAAFRVMGRTLGHALISTAAVGVLAAGAIFYHPVAIPLPLLANGAGFIVAGVTIWSFIDYTRFFVKAYSEWSRSR